MSFGLFQTSELLHVTACGRLLLLKRLLRKVLTSINELMVTVSALIVVATVQVAMVEQMLLSLGLLLCFVVMFLQ